MRTTAEETEKTNKKIIDAAIKVFSEKSYDTADMQDIADAAGLSRGPLYYRYRTKKELYRAAVMEDMHREIEEYRRIWSQDKHFIELLREDLLMCSHNIRYGISLPELMYTPHKDIKGNISLINETSARLYGFVTSAAERAVEKAELKGDTDIQSLVDIIFIFSEGLYMSMSRTRVNITSVKGNEESIEDFIKMVELRYCTA